MFRNMAAFDIFFVFRLLDDVDDVAAARVPSGFSLEEDDLKIGFLSS